MLFTALLLLPTVASSDEGALPRTWVDLHGDGRLSLFVEGGSAGADRIYIPGALGELVESSERVGLAGRPGASESVFADFDGDGRSDLFRVFDGASLELLRFDGEAFVDVTRDVGLNGDARVLAMRVLDFDGDERMDLEVERDRGVTVFRNRRGLFVRALEFDWRSPLVQTAVGGEGPFVDSERAGRTGAEAGTGGSGSFLSIAPAAALSEGVAPRRASSGTPLTIPHPPARQAHPIDPEPLVFPCTSAVKDLMGGGCLPASSQPMLGALYPLSADLNVDASGNVGVGTTAPAGRMHVLDNGASGNPALRVDSTAVSGHQTALLLETDSSLGTALNARSTANSGNALGVVASAASNLGIAVRGWATNGGGVTTGVLGIASSTEGRAVHASATAASGETLGVLAENDSTQGKGVVGHARAATGATIGVHGTSDSTSGTGVRGNGGLFGVFGAATENTGAGVAGAGSTGVSGSSSLEGGVGVHGSAVGSIFSAGGTGVLGEGEIGVVGESTSSGGSGVRGTATESLGTGVYGESTASVGSGVGVHGHSLGDIGIGVMGAGSATGGLATGVVGLEGEEVSYAVGAGVSGTASSNGSAGVVGFGMGDTPAVLGFAQGKATGVGGTADGGGGTGEYLETVGVRGTYPTNAGSGTGVLAESTGWGVGLIATAGTPQVAPVQGTALYATNTGTFAPAVEFARDYSAPALRVEHTGTVPGPASPFGPTLSAAGPGASVTGWTNTVVSAVARSESDPLGTQAVFGYCEGDGIGFGVRGSYSGTNPESAGVLGYSNAGVGVLAAGPTGVQATADKPGALGECGVHGINAVASDALGHGVWGEHVGLGAGVYGSSAGGFGVFSSGDLGVTGVKAFVQPHPTDASRELRFAALEGNESGTYFRGSAALAGGVSVIEVPEEFRLVSESEGLSVQVTSRGPSLLWVESVDLERVLVRGEPDAAFDYVVNGVRRGFRDMEVVRENRSLVPHWRNEPYGLNLPDEVRAILVANGTLNADFTPNEGMAAALGWRLHDRPAPVREPRQRELSADRAAARASNPAASADVATAKR